MRGSSTLLTQDLKRRRREEWKNGRMEEGRKREGKEIGREGEKEGREGGREGRMKGRMKEGGREERN